MKSQQIYLSFTKIDKKIYLLYKSTRAAQISWAAVNQRLTNVGQRSTN